MTARVTTLKGPDAGAYYIDGPGGYYLDGDEPTGRWLGQGAEALGLGGGVEEDDFLAVMDGRDPTGRLLGTGHTERTVRGFDVTCSAPKSVSVLWAVGDRDTRRHVLEAHDAAVDAVLGWVEDHAHCRHRVDGEIWTVDAQGLIAAAFRQHTSRAHDPQLHTHLVIANRVLAPDGRWLALDARTLKHDQRTISALYAAGLRAELTSRLGVRWNAVENGQAEIADAEADVLDAFSQRTGQLQRRFDEKVERFTEHYDRQPTARERWRLEREAAVDSRPSKASADASAEHERWIDQLTELDTTAEGYVAEVTGQTKPVEPNPAMDAVAVSAALSSLRDTQSTWRPAEVTREIAAAMRTDLGATASDVVERTETLASQVCDVACVDISRPIPDDVPLRRDGRPVTEGALDRILTTQPILDEEAHILDLTQRWSEQGGSDATDLTSDDDLTAVQEHAAGAVAGDRRLVLVVGPAGTGKTTAMCPAVAELRASGRSCFGVAPSAASAEVLAVDTGIDADTIDKLLIEHRLDRPPQPRYDLPAGTTVIVDEAAMVATPRLAELIDLAESHRWRLALIGDPMQFSAVGRSGMFGHLVDTHGAIELDRVHRFTASWERDASLRLRRGDTEAVALYDQHERLHGGTSRQMATATVRTWRRSIQTGETAAMMAPTRESVAVLNQIAQQLRFADGELDPHALSVTLGPHRAHPGDVVATRRNDRTLVTDRGRMVKNHDRWTVETVHRDGRLTVTGAIGLVTLPADYVTANVDLAYAETSHATQGRTVDRSFLYLDGPADTRGIYVPMTRGRTTNEAFVVLHDERSPAEVVADAVSRTWIDQPATAQRLDRTRDTHTRDRRPEPPPRPSEPRRNPTGPLPAKDLRNLVKRAAARRRATDAMHWDQQEHDRTIASLGDRQDRLPHEIAAARSRLDHATRILHKHDRPLRRRGHRAEIAHARKQAESLPTHIEAMETELAGLPRAIAAEQRTKDRALQRHRASLLDDGHDIPGAMENDGRARGELAAQHPGAHLLHHLGPIPEHRTHRDLWIDAAGHLAQHHALWGTPPDSSLVGPLPRLGQTDYEVTFYITHQAIDALQQATGRIPPEPSRPAPGLSL